MRVAGDDPAHLAVRRALEEALLHRLVREGAARLLRRVGAREALRVPAREDRDARVRELEVVDRPRVDPLHLLVRALEQEGLLRALDREPQLRVRARANDLPVELERQRRRERGAADDDELARRDTRRVADEDLREPRVRHARPPPRRCRGRLRRARSARRRRTPLRPPAGRRSGPSGGPTRSRRPGP